MPDYIKYKTISVPHVTTTPFSIQGPLDMFLQEIQPTQSQETFQTETTSNNPISFQWTSGGIKEKPYTQASSQITYFQSETPTTNSALNQALRQSADYAKSNVKSKSTHRCAHYVSNALEAAGITGFSREDGKNYDKVVSQLGMRDVTGESTFKKGDIAVTKTNDGTGHVAICNRDGASIDDKDAWSSDFNSRAHPYSPNRISYAHVFRAQNGIKLIKRN